MIKARNSFFIVFLIGIYLSAWLLQDQLYLHWDIGHLMHSARRMLKGGDYLHDFFSPNPPLIMYIYLPPMIMAKFLPLSLVVAFRLYIFGLIGLSLKLCYSLATPLFKADDRIRGLLINLLAFAWLILPLDQLGQRDCLMFVMITPYLFLLLRRLQGGNVQGRTAALVGMLAGLGLALKPQFLITPFLLELYYAYRQGRANTWRRLELASMVAVFVVYGLVLLSFYRDFVLVITPYLIASYYHLVGIPLGRLLAQPLVQFCFFPFLLVALLAKKSLYRDLSTVLTLSLLSFLLIFFMQHNDSLYHLLPSLSLAFVLCSFLLYLKFTRLTITKNDYLALAMVAFLCLSVLAYALPSFRLFTVTYSRTLFGYFALLFCLHLICFETKASRKLSLGILLALLLGYAGSSFIYPQLWDYQYFILGLCYFMLLLGLLLRGQEAYKFKAMFALFTSVAVFALPSYFLAEHYGDSVVYKQTVVNRLRGFMQPYPSHSITVFSASGRYAAPLINESATVLKGRFDCLWMLVALMDAEHLEAKPSLRQPQQDKDFFVKMVADDLHRDHPDFVFVSTKEWAPGSRLDFLAYFSKNQSFREEWKAYQYFTRLEEKPFYELIVYKRQKS